MATRIESGISDYLKEIKGFQLLTADEEKELGTKIQAAAQAETMFANGDISIAQRQRIEREASMARDRMIQANLRLVISVAKHFRNRGLPMEDLVNEGNVGLVNAVDRFDPTVGSRFSTYAGYWIDQAIRRAVQSAQQIIHIPSYLMEQIGHMKLTMNALEEKLERQPSIREVAEHMEITPRKARAITQAIRACTGRTAMNGANGDDRIAETVEDTRTPAPHEGVFTEADADFVHKMLDRITEREAYVLKLRYGLEKSGKKLTLKEIGEVVGLTRERVRQIEKEAKGKLEELLQMHL
ncbi:MAG: RNA polymerase sigma factor RpoD/SigA [Phycisphaerae bacterium]